MDIQNQISMAITMALMDVLACIPLVLIVAIIIVIICTIVGSYTKGSSNADYFKRRR